LTSCWSLLPKIETGPRSDSLFCLCVCVSVPMRYLCRCAGVVSVCVSLLVETHTHLCVSLLVLCA